MITLALATEIEAPRTAVWEAIASPDFQCHWRPGADARLDDVRDTNNAVHHRYRIRLHDVPVVLDVRTIESATGRRRVSELQFGLFRFRETFTLFSRPTGGTRLGIGVAAKSRMPLVGASLDRFDVRRFATDVAATTLQAVRDWCESGTAPALEMPRFAANERRA